MQKSIKGLYFVKIIFETHKISFLQCGKSYLWMLEGDRRVRCLLYWWCWQHCFGWRSSLDVSRLFYVMAKRRALIKKKGSLNMKGPVWFKHKESVFCQCFASICDYCSLPVALGVLPRCTVRKSVGIMTGWSTSWCAGRGRMRGRGREDSKIGRSRERTGLETIFICWKKWTIFENTLYCLLHLQR